ncbi:unnamed protein product [Penicillium olsonii]|nr:unnamed protein product [Penicillium olsonii]CAG7934308.1 unnamed protein product [Penicillium olsonii]
MIEDYWPSISSIDSWKILLTIFLVINFKSLPFVFHYRIFRPIIHSLFRKKQSHQFLSDHAQHKESPLVFRPCITTTYTPLLEADYNLHKSNSTYFTDLDASRSHLLSYLCHYGITIVDQELTAEGKHGMMAAIIGSVTTSFKKEIKIFQQYEVWSRILTWDRKWLYIVTHFVRKGTVKQDIHTETGKFPRTCAPHKVNSKDNSAQPVVFATSVSKYVFKKGRLTVPPERLLRTSGLLGDMGNGEEAHTQNQGSQLKSVDSQADKENEHVADLELGQSTEKERLRGLRYAESWDELEPLHGELLRGNETSSSIKAIGHFSDLAGYGISYK